ncbi:hypothetical protein [Paenibacillus amylolyticus]|uniref:hypothetical protein n=1 Tax=Paenibacillus amylolyticus TaxID=1451 RepID=UPI003D9989AA
MSDMNHLNYNNDEHPEFNEISGEEKLQALRDLIELTDSLLTQQVLAIGMDTHEEDLIRIEAWRALGMAGSSPLLDEIQGLSLRWNRFNLIRIWALPPSENCIPYQEVMFYESGP